MNEVLQNFGFDFRLFLAQVVNFLIILFIFRKFLYPKILDMMKKREEKIRQGLNDANLAEKALALAEEKQDEIIKKAGIEADKIISEAKKTAEEAREESLTQTRNQAQKIINEAKEQASLELEKVRKEAESIALSISQTILTKALEGMFSENEKKTIVEKNIKSLASLRGGATKQSRVS